jgi:hypothetical protein
MLSSFERIPSWLALHWRTSIAVACLVGIAVASKSILETSQTRGQRTELNRKKELRKLADRILTYGHKTHHRYPTGDVVVSVNDLADRLRKRPEAVAAALDVLLGEQKVQRAPLGGYWKLNV